MHERLVERMKELGYREHWISLTEKWVNELQQRGVCEIGWFIRKLTDRVCDKDAYLDILMEGRIALILAKNAFSEITFIREEENRSLPDLKANWNRSTVYFEVTRKRPGAEDEQFSQSGAHFVERAKTENISVRIQEKLKQLKSGEINVVVYCSETVRIGTPDIQEAFKYIQQEICNDPERYKKLSGILSTESAEVPATDIWEVNLLKNNNALRPLGKRLTSKLKSLQVN
jgi:hypothetical protein